MKKPFLNMSIQYQGDITGINATDTPRYPADIIFRQQEQQRTLGKQRSHFLRKRRQLPVPQDIARSIYCGDSILRPPV